MMARRPVLTQLLSNRNLNTITLLLCLIFVTGSLAVKVTTPGNVTALVGNTVTLTCNLDGEGRVVQMEWNRCKNDRFLIYHTEHGAHANEDYKERVSTVTNSSFTLQEARANDSGSYCCILSTYPHGTLQGRLALHIHTDTSEASFSSVVIVATVCAVLVIAVLGGSLSFMVFYQGRRVKVRNPVHVAVHSGGLPQNNHVYLTQNPPPTHSKREKEEEKDVEKEEAGAEYFNFMTSSCVTPSPNSP